LMTARNRSAANARPNCENIIKAYTKKKKKSPD
jgi:hypothetical protein